MQYHGDLKHDRTDELNERSQHLLRVLVESYIRDGEPVGSRTLSRESGLTISSATIRNVMADLEELGFIASPHTSAGRVPTDTGYRFFVTGVGRRHCGRPKPCLKHWSWAAGCSRGSTDRNRCWPRRRRCCRT